jgi:GT2 family glycosyltransferase
MMKLKKLINKRGIRLGKPSHWLTLIKYGIGFIQRHGLRSNAALRANFHRYSIVDTLAHAQIWERIKPSNSELAKLQRTIPNLNKHYTFSVIMPNEDFYTVSSVKKQIYDKFEILFGNPKETVARSSCDYVLFLQPGDFLHEDAFFELVFELNRIKNTPPLLYFDHDYSANNTVDKPYYKPGWSPDLLLVNNYINRACVFRRDLLNKTEIEDRPFYAALYDITLKLSEFGQGHHKPGILLTMPNADDERGFDTEENIVRSNALLRRNMDGVIEANKYGVASLKRKLAENPKISIIIPTCFKGSFVGNCLKSIERITTYKNYEIIVIDNSRKSPDFGKNRLRGFDCKILYVNEPFNWSRLNNLGTNEASGELLLFLNDDTEILTPDWLERMAAEARRPEIGAVSVLQLYPNGTVYSGGIFNNMSPYGTEHSFKYEDEFSVTYHNLLHYTRPAISFQGACFIIEKAKLDKAGGFNEMFSVTCNEPDLAFRLKQNDYCSLFFAEVQITHFELASRGKTQTRTEKENNNHLWEIWYDELYKNDTYFNPYLDRRRYNYSENQAPVIYRLSDYPSFNKSFDKTDEITKDNPILQDGLLIGMRINRNNSHKSWPILKYAQLCDLIVTRLNAKIVLPGSRQEIKYNEELIRLVKNKDMVISMTGEISSFKFDYFIDFNGVFAHIVAIQGISALVVIEEINPCNVYNGLERLMVLYP